MKYLMYAIIAIATLLLGYNVTKIDWKQPFQGDSSVALIGVLACACAILLLVILMLSKKIEHKSKKRY